MSHLEKVASPFFGMEKDVEETLGERIAKAAIEGTSRQIDCP